jgi:hypothetical protein
MTTEMTFGLSFFNLNRYAVATCCARIKLRLQVHTENLKVTGLSKSWQVQPGIDFLRATPRDSPHQCACLSPTSRSGLKSFISLSANADLDKRSQKLRLGHPMTVFVAYKYASHTQLTLTRRPHYDVWKRQRPKCQHGQDSKQRNVRCPSQ